MYIPKHIEESEDLNLQDKYVFGVIESLTRKEGYCYATNEYIASRCVPLGVRGVRNIIGKLAKLGFLIVDVQKIKKDPVSTGNEWGTRRKIYVWQHPDVNGGGTTVPTGVAPQCQYSLNKEPKQTHNVGEEETLKKTEVEINKEAEVTPEPSVSEDIRSFSKTSQVGQPKEKKSRWGQRAFASSKPEPNRGTLEDSLRDNLPMIGNKCGQEIKDMAKRCQVFKKDVFQKKQEYIAWVKSKPNDPSRWGLDMASTVETFINRAIASGEIEKYIPLKQQLIEAGYEIVGEKT